MELLPSSYIGVDGPWLVIAAPTNPMIRLNVTALDRVKFAKLRDKGHTASGLDLEVEDDQVQLHVADGREAAKGVAARLAPYTRNARITRADVYEDAVRRLQTRGESDRGREPILIVGEETVSARDGVLQIGNLVKYKISEVGPYAKRAEDLPLPGGGSLQAALAMLVVAAEGRGEDFALLAKRIAAYEKKLPSR